MSDETEKKWEFVDKHLTKKQHDLPQQANPITPAVVDGTSGQPQGIVENWKSNKIERLKRIEMLTAKSKAQLEAYKHYVEGQLAVVNQRIDLHVQQQLDEISRQHLLHLQEIGISNYEDRQRALQELSKRSAEQLQKVESMDVPAMMKQKLLNAIFEGYEKLFDKIQSDEIRTPTQRT